MLDLQEVGTIGVSPSAVCAVFEGEVDYALRRVRYKIRPTKIFVAGGLQELSKALPLTGMIVAGLIGVLFLADLAAQFPFQRVSVGADVGFCLGSLILAYLSWTVLAKARG